MELRPYQTEAISAIYHYLRTHNGNPCCVLPTGCHELNHPIRMADGSVKSIQHITVGEEVLGPDNKPRKVLQLCRGRDRMFVVKSNRAPAFRVNGDHIMSLWIVGRKKFATTSVRDYMSFPASFRAEDYFRLHTMVRKGQVFRLEDVKWKFRICEDKEDDFYGFVLSGDHLYLDAFGIVHHNSGKTPVLASLCNDAVKKKWNGRVLILAHVKELLEQAKDKLSMFCPNIPIGLYSAGLGEKTSDGPIIVAGIQSVYRKAQELGMFDLIIVDECHLLPEDGDGMYRQFLSEMKALNPAIRLVGLTATPYRMSSGWLCGADNLLNDVCYEVGVKELITQGYLCPLITKGSKRQQDYSGLHIRAGEFVSSEVESLVNTEANVYAACREILEQTADRNKVLVFACSVEHAKRVQKTLSEMTGMECGLVTGSTPIQERDQLLRRFKGEEVRSNLFGETLATLKYMTNVNVLTTGFDAQDIDCVVMLRPTASPGLYQQMVGRGLLLHPSKTNCLILDFGGNILRHGPIDAIHIKDKRTSGDGEPPAKQCPECQLIIHAAYTICPGCGYTFPARESTEIDNKASEENVLSCDQTNEYDVEDVFYAVHTKAGTDDSAPKTMRVDYKIGWNSFRSEWLCVEHEGWPRKKFEHWWNERTQAPLPSSAYEAVQIANCGALAKPSQITVIRKAGEKYERVNGYVLDPIPDESPEIVTNPAHTCDQCLNYSNGWCGATFQKNLPPESCACGQFLDKEDIPF